MAVLISDDEFESKVHREVTKLGGPTSGFPRWYLTDLVGLRGANVDSALCDPTKDLGLDAFYADEEFFYLLQFKYHHPAPGSIVSKASDNALNQLRNCWGVVSDLKKATQMWNEGAIRETLLSAAKSFNLYVLNDVKKVKMVVVEFTKGDTADAEDWYADLCMDLVGNEHFADTPVIVSNFHTMLNTWMQNYVPSSRIEAVHTLPYLADQGVIEYVPTGGVSPTKYKIGSGGMIDGTSVVVNVKGIDLALLYEQRDVRDRLFDPNVRFEIPQGTEFKKDMKETIEQSPEHFWHYNNGITVLCREFEVTSTGELKILAPGVVNGCQTIKQLHRTHPTKGLQVLVRVMKSNNEDLDRDIALYTNTQNPVTRRDLMSGRLEQKYYSRTFRELDNAWFLEIKRGSWGTLTRPEQESYKALGQGRPKRMLSNEYVLSAAIAFCLQDPVIAKTDKSRWWDKKYYDEVFLKKRSPYELIAAALVQMALEKLRDETDSEGKPVRPQMSYCVPHLSALVKMAIADKYASPSEGEWKKVYSALMDPTTKYPRDDSFVKSLYDGFLSDFLDELFDLHRTAQQKADPTVDWDPATYFKNAANWNSTAIAGSFLPYYDKFLQKRKKLAVPKPKDYIP